ncbi:MAG: endonuclease/exonuclease/phosphatase family protein, partial [Methanomicrobium sp.]|nr:endonuclease/exonuclease/phosphatase family protein [Methanomicrobium sp.]
MSQSRRRTSKSQTPLLLKTALVIIIVVFAVSQKDVISDSFQNNFASQTDENLINAAAFNIQVFGTSKAAKDDVMDILAKVVRKYDIIAVQEIRDSSETALVKLVELVNSDGSSYSYFVSERLGRTSSKEQYAIIYNTKKVEPIGVPFTYPELLNTDPFHREPYIGSFKSVKGIFNATFVVIHTDPDEAKEEIDALYEVAEFARTILPGDEAVVVMGDFNADGSYFNEDSYTPMKSEGYTWIIGNSLDTTTGATDCTYDRIVITGDDSFYTGTSGVMRFDTEYS